MVHEEPFPLGDRQGDLEGRVTHQEDRQVVLWAQEMHRVGREGVPLAQEMHQEDPEGVLLEGEILLVPILGDRDLKSALFSCGIIKIYSSE